MSTYALHDDLYALVVYLHAASNRDLWELLQEEHISVTQAKILDRLRGGIHPTIGQTARLTGISHSAACVAIDGLARRGYVRREVDDDDKRARRVVLTDKGDRTIARLHAARYEQIIAFTDELEPDTADELRAGLRPVLRRQDIARFRPVPLPA